MKKIFSIISVVLLIFVNTAYSSNISLNEKTSLENEREYWGVVVTIVDYENDINDLNLPVDMVYRPLISASNWDEEHVLFLNNKNATVENISKSLDWLAETVDENDIALFYFGGHGYRIPDTNGDEADGKDECITGYEKRSIIPDDNLSMKFDNISAEGLIIIIDCCHSGGVVDYNKSKQKMLFSENQNSEFSNDLINDFNGCGRVFIASDFEQAVCQEIPGFGTMLALSLEYIISKSKGDKNNDNIISIEETFLYLKKIFRRVNFLILAGGIGFLSVVKLLFGKQFLKLTIILGISAVVLWELFCFKAFKGFMIPYYPIIVDEYTGELPFVEINQ